VGSFVVQIAAALGPKVTATASANDKAFVTELGATTVIDYASQRCEDHVTDVDVVIDLVGGQTQARPWQIPRGMAERWSASPLRPRRRKPRGTAPAGVLRRHARPSPAQRTRAIGLFPGADPHRL
jgi:hypothetical protein